MERENEIHGEKIRSEGERRKEEECSNKGDETDEKRGGAVIKGDRDGDESM